mmetsp:Transcript_1153/g.7498  ORF Transcript_1153/g.7498 Transcript_1153/m.7498 type:complete len:252 (+) Transcript_1153:291-1046(+)
MLPHATECSDFRCLAIWHRRTSLSCKHSTIQVGICQLDSLHVLLLIGQLLAIAQQRFNGHLGPLEGHGTVLRVDQPLAQILDPNTSNEVAYHVIVHTRTKSTKEIDGLAREGIHKQLYVLLRHAILTEDAHRYTNAILPGWLPVELLHTPITNERGIQGGEIVTGTDDRHTGVLLSVVDTGQLHIGWAISNVHQSGIDHLVVDGVLGSTTHTTCSSIQIVDEKGSHLSLLNDVSSLAVALADELGRLSSIS